MFREYLRIKTVHPKPDYKTAVDFLFRKAKEMGLPCHQMEVILPIFHEDHLFDSHIVQTRKANCLDYVAWKRSLPSISSIKQSYGRGSRSPREMEHRSIRSI